MKPKKKVIRVLFWHNDFSDNTRQHAWFGKEGPIKRRVVKSLKSGQTVKWHFHGGYITACRTMLLRRLYKADVFITAYPWNMDMDDENMLWPEAEESFIEVIREAKEKNKKLKVFSMEDSHYPENREKLISLGVTFLENIHGNELYQYFSER